MSERPIHDMLLDRAKVAGLRFFMAVTGCEQVSFSGHVSKATTAWKFFPEVNETFAILSSRPTEADTYEYQGSHAFIEKFCGVAVP